MGSNPISSSGNKIERQLFYEQLGLP